VPLFYYTTGAGSRVEEATCVPSFADLICAPRSQTSGATKLQSHRKIASHRTDREEKRNNENDEDEDREGGCSMINEFSADRVLVKARRRNGARVRDLAGHDESGLPMGSHGEKRAEIVRRLLIARKYTRLVLPRGVMNSRHRLTSQINPGRYLAR